MLHRISCSAQSPPFSLPPSHPHDNGHSWQALHQNGWGWAVFQMPPQSILLQWATSQKRIRHTAHTGDEVLEVGAVTHMRPRDTCTFLSHTCVTIHVSTTHGAKRPSPTMQPVQECEIPTKWNSHKMDFNPMQSKFPSLSFFCQDEIANCIFGMLPLNKS